MILAGNVVMEGSMQDLFALYAVPFREGNRHTRVICTGSTPEDARARATTLVEQAGLTWKIQNNGVEPIQGAYFALDSGTIVKEGATAKASA